MKTIKSTKRLLALALVCLVVLFAFGINAKAVTTKISVIWSNPGENCSESVSFSWQSTDAKSVFNYALKSEDFSSENEIEVNGSKTEHFTTYSYKLEINNLSPNTTYKYKITSGDATSEVYEVTTASVAASFNFAWVSDIHTHTGSGNRINYADQLLKQMTKDSGGYNMILSTGDEVAYGGNLAGFEMLTGLQYNSTIQTTMWAGVPGNHTYYPDGGNKLVTNQFFEAMTNHPDNGYDEVSSSYWFLYNSVLFVGLDSLTIQNSSSTLSSQQAWFRRVMAQNEGKYQYIIVFQHFPWLNALTGALTSGYYSNYKAWYEIFDEYNVDICLAGDYHTYYRSNKLYKNEPVSIDNPNGTVYMGNRQIGGRAAGGSYYIKDRQNPTYFACRLDNEYSESSGAGYFTVTSEGISWKMYDHKTMKVVDEMYLPAKRGINWENNKDKVVESTFFTSSEGLGYVNFNTLYKDYLEKVTVKDNSGKELASVSPSVDHVATLVINGLEKNKSYELNVVYKFVDGSSKETKINGNTYGNYGKVSGFNVTSENGKVKAMFDYDLLNSVIVKFEVYENDKLVDTFTPTTEKGKYEKSIDVNIKLDAIYKLVGKNSSNDIIYSAKKQYSFYGDIDVDGKFDINDIEASFALIDSAKELDKYVVLLNDFNGDGVFDIGDCIMMYMAVKDNVKHIKENVYTVVYLDFYGNIASVQEVKEGSDAVCPEFDNVTGYTFDYLSGSDKNITSDVVIKAVYKAN